MIDHRSKEGCCGCGACANACPVGCISMNVDVEGFAYPCVDHSSCVSCGRCEAVCPFASDTEDAPVTKVWAGWSRNEAIRQASSSGGVFTELATDVISQGGCVFGVAMDNGCRTCSFREVGDECDLSVLRGSKYVQVIPGGVYRDVRRALDSGRPVLFCGTPCQTNALYNYLPSDYGQLIVVDFVCHGVPSPALWEKYLSHIERSYHMPVKSVSFRSKEVGWRQFGLSFIGEYGKSLFLPKDHSSFFEMFMKNLSLRPSCYECRAKRHREADMTIGDFWGIEQALPEISDDSNITHAGCSLIITRSPKGEEALVSVSQRLVLYETTYTDAVDNNVAEHSSVNRPEKRDEFFADMVRMDYVQLENRYVYPKTKHRVKKALIKLGLWHHIQRWGLR